MGYTIVKSIKICMKTKSVYITGACNNVYPRTYTKRKCEYYSDILKIEGRECLDRELCLDYWEGNMQGTKNIYDRSMYHARLEFPWQIVGVDGEVREWHDREEYENYVKNTIYPYFENYKNRDKTKIILKKITGSNEGYYLHKCNKKSDFLSKNIKQAKVFTGAKDAAFYVKGIPCSSELVIHSPNDVKEYWKWEAVKI